MSVNSKTTIIYKNKYTGDSFQIFQVPKNKKNNGFQLYTENMKLYQDLLITRHKDHLFQP